jgi:vacuolar iron transporter family protein
LPREFWPPEQVYAEDYPYAGYPPYAEPPPAARAWGNAHPRGGPARVNGRPGPRYAPAGGRAAPWHPNAQGNPGYPPAGGHAHAGPGLPTRPPGPGYRPGPVNGRPVSGPGVSGPGVSGPGVSAPGVSGPGTWPAGVQQASRYPFLIAPGADVPDQVVAGRRVLDWLPLSLGRRLVLLPRIPAPARWDQPLREHRDVSGGWLRPAVFGAMDGLVTNSSLIAGIGGGGGGHGAIVLTGIAGLIAGAFSMATGEYISVTSQNELTAAEVELERMQHVRDPAGKQDRLAEIFMDKGVSPNLAEAVARQISADQDRAVATHVREELGIDPDDLPSPRTAAAASFAAFTVGALIPLSPFLAGFPILWLALALAGVAAIAGGAAVAKLTNRSMLAGGLRQFTAAFLATGVSFAVGHLIGGVVS